MKREEIFETVLRIVRDVIDDDNIVITEDTYFVDELEFGSLDVMEMLMEIEDEFNITIPEVKASQFVQVRDFIDFLEEIC